MKFSSLSPEDQEYLRSFIRQQINPPVVSGR
jgi:hypothetical protein